MGIFAGQEEDLKGVSSNLIEHKLERDQKVQPIKQKLRNLGEKEETSLTEIYKKNY